KGEPVLPPPSTIPNHRVQRQRPVSLLEKEATGAPPSARTRLRTRIRADGGIVPEGHGRLQVFSVKNFSTGVRRQDRTGGLRGRREGRDLRAEPVAIEDQEQQEATEDHGPQRDAEQGDVDVALG